MINNNNNTNKNLKEIAEMVYEICAKNNVKYVADVKNTDDIEKLVKETEKRFELHYCSNFDGTDTLNGFFLDSHGNDCGIDFFYYKNKKVEFDFYNYGDYAAKGYYKPQNQEINVKIDNNYYLDLSNITDVEKKDEILKALDFDLYANDKFCTCQIAEDNREVVINIDCLLFVVDKSIVVNAKDSLLKFADGVQFDDQDEVKHYQAILDTINTK